MADKVEIAEDILKLSFEEALGELESIVDRLETVMSHWKNRLRFISAATNCAPIAMRS